MRHGPVALVLAALLLAAAGCEQKPIHGGRPAGVRPAGTEPPQGLDEAPLLLEDGPPAEALAGAGADNSRCHVCHINYVGEELAVTHARVDIGCARCHGESDAHIADESWASGGKGTAPDIMYPRPKINAFCLSCHPKKKIDTEEHKALFAATGKQKYCTDCHGKHRLAKRRCTWK